MLNKKFFSSKLRIFAYWKNVDCMLSMRGICDSLQSCKNYNYEERFR